jgi:iron-sulfur cluster repair protein YtfE (RIC family)
MKHKIHAAILAAALATGGALVWATADNAPTETEAMSSGQVAAAGSGKELVTQPLRDEHKGLLPHIEALATAGDAVGVAPKAEQVEKVHASYEFLSKQLIPHAEAENKVLYVEVDRLIGSDVQTKATDTMVRDHAEVGALTEELGAFAAKLHEGNLSPAEQQDLRQVLYSLNGIVGLHFDKEEEVYLPLLDRELSAAEAQKLFDQMEKVTASEGGTTHQH